MRPSSSPVCVCVWVTGESYSTPVCVFLMQQRLCSRFLLRLGRCTGREGTSRSGAARSDILLKVTTTWCHPAVCNNAPLLSGWCGVWSAPGALTLWFWDVVVFCFVFSSHNWICQSQPKWSCKLHFSSTETEAACQELFLKIVWYKQDFDPVKHIF